jgi:antitoxin VapB
MEIAMTQSAKIFMNGRSQAVRLPAEFRFDTKEVDIRRDAQTGDVVLSSKPERLVSWEELIRMRDGVEVPDDFPYRENTTDEAQSRDPFEDWEE